MAEETHLYRYASNKDPWDTTARIVVSLDDDGNGLKYMDLGGSPVELTEEEAANARRRFNVTKLSDEQAEKVEVVDDAGNTAPVDEDESDQGSKRRSRRGGKAAESGADNAGVVDPSEGGSAGPAGGTTTGGDR